MKNERKYISEENKMKTIIVTDSCCDLPYTYIKENHIEVLAITVNMNEKDMKDNLAETGEYETFYKQIAEGAMPKTSQINVYEFKEVFMKHVKQGNQVLYIGFSAALSGCVNSARMAAEEIKKDMRDASITVVDSACASMGQGLLVYNVVEQLKRGKSLEELLAYIEENKQKVNHWFTVTDLNHLFRGGRVSRTAATLGSILQIKPILTVDEEGKLIAKEKAKGRKKSLKILVEKIKERSVSPEEQTVFISHAAVLEEAQQMKQAIMESCSVKDVWINEMGAAVGSHVGPGALAVFFMGDTRQ